MDNKTMIFMYIMMSACFVVLAICLIYKYVSKKKGAGRDILVGSNGNKRNRLYFLYRIFRVTPVIKRYYARTKQKYRALYPTDEITLNIITTKRMTFSLFIGIAIVMGTILLCSGDIPYLIVGLCAAYIVFTNIINSSEDKLQKKILDQTDVLITNIHANYHETSMVDESILMSVDCLPHEISLHAEKLLKILQAPDVEAEVEKYVSTAPNKFLLLLAAVCASVMEYGDKKDEEGKSLFLKNLNYLKSELNEERLRLQRKENIFKGKVFSVLIPLFCLKPAETLLTFNMPELAGFYSGLGGMVSLAVITATTLICYEIINILKDDGINEENENKYLKALSEFPIVKKYINLYAAHNYSKAKRLTDMLKATGDKNGYNVFMIKRILFAIVAFIIVNVVSFFAINRSKTFILSDFSESYSESLVPSEEYRKTMKEISLELNGTIKAKRELREDIIEYAKSRGVDTTFASQIADELEAKRQKFHGYYYKWWVLLLTILAAVVAYNIPYLLLKYKSSVKKQSREDEVAQFRTLILILMHQDGMNIDTALEWLERFANSFKQSISKCIINLEYSQIRALETLRDDESDFAPFTYLCNSLIATDKSDFEGAFDDLETEREYYQEKRKEDNQVRIKKAGSLAGRVQMIPIWEIIILYVIIPFSGMVINMFSDFSSVI